MLLLQHWDVRHREKINTFNWFSYLKTICLAVQIMPAQSTWTNSVVMNALNLHLQSADSNETPNLFSNEFHRMNCSGTSSRNGMAQSRSFAMLSRDRVKHFEYRRIRKSILVINDCKTPVYHAVSYEPGNHHLLQSPFKRPSPFCLLSSDLITDQIQNPSTHIRHR